MRVALSVMGLRKKRERTYDLANGMRMEGLSSHIGIAPPALARDYSKV